MVVVGVKTMIRLAARAGGTRLLGLKRRFQSENTMAQGAFVWADIRKLFPQWNRGPSYH